MLDDARRLGRADRPRVEIGALVTCNSYRNPELLADMARTVDHISGGRLILGIGSGWFEKDYDEYGYEFGTAGAPARRPGRRRCRGSRPRWATLNPAPTRQIPVLIGGGGESKTLRLSPSTPTSGTASATSRRAAQERRSSTSCCARGRPRPGRDRALGRRAGRAGRASADACVAAGATLFTVGLGGPDYDLGPLKEWLAWRDVARRG